MSESVAYARGENPRSLANLHQGHPESLVANTRTIHGAWTWLRRGELPDKPWAGEVLEEVEALIGDEISRIGGEDQLEAIDRSDLNAVRVAGVAHRLCSRQWAADGLPVGARKGVPAYLSRDWLRFVQIERRALAALRERHVGRRSGPQSVADALRAEVVVRG